MDKGADCPGQRHPATHGQLQSPHRCQCGGLQERPHEDEQLAKLGVMQYEYTFVEKKHTKEQELQLQEHVEDVATDDFNAMRLALGGGCKQKTITTKGASVAWWQLACNRQ